LRLGPNEIGVSCSTIIAAIFESEGFKLLDPTSWPDADEADKRARRGVIAWVRKYDPQHASAMEGEIDAPRVRPFEVVAAAAIFPTAASFEQAVDGAAVVEERLAAIAG
jgi:hypothetical protein